MWNYDRGSGTPAKEGALRTWGKWAADSISDECFEQLKRPPRMSSGELSQIKAFHFIRQCHTLSALPLQTRTLEIIY